MKIIAHRGNVDGSNYSTENHPYQVLYAIFKGFDVEVDVWVIEDSSPMIYLGHDKPEYLVDENFFIHIGKHAWFHCKNLNALNFFNEKMPEMNYFWHENDDYTITSKGYIWANPGKQIGKNFVLVLPENTFEKNKMVASARAVSPYAICTDYAESFI